MSYVPHVEPYQHSWRWTNFPVPEAHLIVGAAGVMLGLIWPLPIGWVGTSSRVTGAVLIVCGVGLMIWATASVGSVLLSDPDQLVDGGPYSFSRHPMYVGWTLAYLGFTVLFDWAWLLILFPILAVWINREASREEQRMLQRFGTDYRDYQSKVRRYL